jgi:DNA-directed RNA polymerase specialized sigma24 family protein
MMHEGRGTPGERRHSGEPLQLISAAADGDMAAFEHLYRRYSPRIYGLCLRLTGNREAAEDCTQETFIDAWRALFRFEGRSSFSTWLHSIAIRAVLSRRRGLRLKFEVAEPAAGMPEQTDLARRALRRSIWKGPSPHCPKLRVTCWYWLEYMATAMPKRPPI